MKRGETVSEFAKLKTMSEQRWYLENTTQLKQYLYQNGYTTNSIMDRTQPWRVDILRELVKRWEQSLRIKLGTRIISKSNWSWVAARHIKFHHFLKCLPALHY